MASPHHEPVYESPSGYGENIGKKGSIKLDSRQSNISKIRIRKAKVSFSSDNADASYQSSMNWTMLIRFNAIVDLSTPTKSEVGQNRYVFDLLSAELLL